MTRGNFRVEFTSDWHVGTGAGRSGDVDRLIAREWVRVGDKGTPFQVPVLPAKTLTGILRDAAERLAFGLDKGDKGTDQGLWSGYVRWMFGDPEQPARLSIRPGHLSAPLIKALGEDQLSLSGLTIIRASTAIDPATGTAAEHTLRTIEVGRSGTVFDAVWELVDDGAPTVTVDDEDRHVHPVRFLATAAALVDGIGAKRRRGLGRCTCELRSDESASKDLPNATRAAVTLDDLLLGTEATPARIPSTTTPTTVDELAQQLTLLLRAETKLLVGTTSFGNLVQGCDYIPGRFLFPAICDVLRRTGHDTDGLINSNAVCVGDANPVHPGSGARLEPVPLALSRVKEPDHAGATPVINTLSDSRSDTQAKQLRNGFVDPNYNPSPDTPLELVAVRREITTHNSIDDELQRPTESVGGVYTYDSIAAGQLFAAVVEVSQSVAKSVAKSIMAIQDDVLTIGRSAKDDYGLVRVVQVDTGPATQDALTGTERQESQEVLVWCTSDVLVADNHIRYDPSASSLVAALCDNLKIRDDDCSFRPEHVRIRSRRVDGFSRRWGLPAATHVVVQRGSALRLTITGAPKIPDGHVVSIGERTAEGYGRVVLNPQLLSSTSTQSSIASDLEHVGVVAGRLVVPEDSGLTEADRKVFDRSRAESYMNDIRARIDDFVGVDHPLLITGDRPSRSTVGQLRRRLLQSSEVGERHPATGWFRGRRIAAIGDRPTDCEKKWFDEATKLLSDPNYVWELLLGERDDAGNTDPLESDLWQPAVLALFEAIDRGRNEIGAVPEGTSQWHGE